MNHLNEYREIRKLHQEISDKMFEYYMANEKKYQEQLSGNLKESYEKGWNVQGFNVNFIDSTQNHTYFDLLFYKNFETKCISETFLEKKKVRSEKKVTLVNAMLNSVCSLYKVVEVKQEECVVVLENVFTAEKITITDERLGLNEKIKDKLLFLRIITYKGINFLSGLTYVFDKNDSDVRKWIKKHKKHRIEPARVILELYKIYYKL